MSMDYSLQKIVAPVAVSTFLAEYWEAKPLVVARDRPDYFASLLTLGDIDRVLTTLSLHHPEVGIVNAARRVAPEEYSYPSGLIDASRIFQQFADGGTMVFQQLETRVPALAALCRAMESELSTRFQTNVYVSPAQAQGFRAHYDSHDVFVLQVHGRKRWQLYDTPVELPYRLQEFNPAEVTAGPVSAEFELSAGDVAYIPRGVMHDARTEVGQSVHITLGVMFKSWTDLLAESLALVGLRDPAFRKSLPPGFARADFDRSTAREAFRDLLRRFAESAEFDAALEHFIGDLVSTRHPLIPGQFEQVQRLAALTAETRVGVRPSLIYQLREDAGSVNVACYGATLTLPAHAAEPLRFALTHDAYTPRDLPGDLDDAGRLVLVRRLVREGLVQILS
jgi:ribosomal protein L16 Arg81 hydroxylase